MSDTLGFAGLLEVLGFTDTDFVAIGHYVGDGEFSTAVRLRDEAPGYAASLPDEANAFFSVNAVAGPARERAGRGTADQITRLRDLPVDLDFKAGACPDLKTAMAIIFDLSVVLGTRPSVLVDSGHGVHAHWVIDDGQITDVGTARALVKRWGRLVKYVAKEQHGVHVDSVFDLSRMMRIPDSYNNKQLNGEAPQLVTARLDSGGPLTMAEVSERLDEAGIVERVEDRAVSGAEVSPPDTWECADRTCTYVAKMINRWVTDRPPPGGARNPYVYNRHIRLFCALRNGCVSADDFQRAQQILDDVLTELVTTTEPRRNVRLYEFHELRKYGIVRTASKTDDEVHAELGCHNHPGVNVPAPAANGQQPPPGGGQAHSSQQTGGQQAGGGQASSGPAAGQQAPAPLHRPRGSRWTSVRGSAALSSRRHRRSASPAPTGCGSSTRAASTPSSAKPSRARRGSPSVVWWPS